MLFYLSAQSEPPRPDLEIPGLDKAAHFVLYAGLAGLVSLGLGRARNPVSARVRFYAPIAFAIFYGLTDEIHQYFVPHRAFDLLDLVADGFGALTVQVVLFRVLWREPPDANRAPAR